ILAAIGPAALVEACGQPASHEGTTGAGAGQELPPDSGADADGRASVDAPESSDGDAAPAEDADAQPDCSMVTVMYDAGIDVEPGCLYSLPCGVADEFSFVGCEVYSGITALGCTLVPDAGCSADAYAPGPGGAVQIDCTMCLGG